YDLSADDLYLVAFSVKLARYEFNIARILFLPEHNLAAVFASDPGDVAHVLFRAHEAGIPLGQKLHHDPVEAVKSRHHAGAGNEILGITFGPEDATGIGGRIFDTGDDLARTGDVASSVSNRPPNDR